MYLRFVVRRLDPNSGRRQGLFHAVYHLRQFGVLAPHDDDYLGEIGDWFKRRLKVPTRFSLSARPNRKAQALSWLRDDAKEHVARMHEFQSVLERYGMPVQMINTRRPGYIVYRDQHQVAAYPFSDTPT
jgi:hypothetical protein